MRWLLCLFCFFIPLSFFHHPLPLLALALRDLHYGKEPGIALQAQKKETFTPKDSSSNIMFPFQVLTNHYRTNAELEAAMKNISKTCGSITRLYSIGKSVRGFPLWVLEIADHPGVAEPEPSFKFVGNMHGDEPMGRELLLHLADWLCSNYLKDSLVTDIVQKLHLHLLPSMNPDGFAEKNRLNANDVDLNRDFPDQFFPRNNNENGRQPETQAVMQWTRNLHFVASASLHEGAVVANYPWDGTPNGSTQYFKCPDDSSFRYLASIYSQFHPNMSKSKEFKDGITNGAEWYPLYGGMQDWNYIHGDSLDLTLEISDEKWPPADQILHIWDDNKQSMLELVASIIKSGLHGKVKSTLGYQPLPATIMIEGVNYSIKANAKAGNFHRILTPGMEYKVTASMPGYKSQTHHVKLSKDKPAILNFLLEPETGNHQLATSYSQTRASEPQKSSVGAAAPVSRNIWTLTRQFWASHLSTVSFPAPSSVPKNDNKMSISTNLAQQPLQKTIKENKDLMEGKHFGKVKEDNIEDTESLVMKSILNNQLRMENTLFDEGILSEVAMHHLRLSSFCFMIVLTSVIFFFIILKWKTVSRLRGLRHFTKRPTKV